jgi:hypothetical protein
MDHRLARLEKFKQRTHPGEQQLHWWLVVVLVTVTLTT